MKKVTDEIFSVSSLDDILKLKETFDRTTHIKFNCSLCGKEYVGTIRETLKKGILYCKQCNINKTKIERYGIKTYNNSKKACETNIKKYGVSCAFKRDDVRKHNSDACKSFERREKITKALKSHDDNYWRDLQEKKNKNIIEKYGSLKKFYEKRVKKQEETCLKKYGVKNVGVLNAEKEYSSLQKYFYDGRFFDSSYELKYYIWLKDNNISFEYHNKKYFLYKRKDGSTHRYYPDFFVNGKFIEIKGDFWFDRTRNCLINKNGEVDEEKTECLKRNSVEIKLKEDLKDVFEYVDIKYGKNFVKQFKYKKEHKENGKETS